MRVNIKLNDKALLKGLSNLERSFPNVVKAIRKEFGAEAVIQGKKFFTPVVTGNLVSTLRVVARGKKVFFVAGGIKGKGTPSRFVDYAGYVNDGTSRIAPRLFMEKSVLSASKQASSLSKDILASWLNSL